MEYKGVKFTVQLSSRGMEVIAKGSEVPSLNQSDINHLVMSLNDHMPLVIADEIVTGSTQPLLVTENMVTLALRKLGKALTPQPVIIIESAPPRPGGE